MSQMIDEIRQQPDALARTLSAGAQASAALRRYFRKRTPRMLYFAARGTSDHAAEFGRYLVEISTGIPCSLAAPSVITIYRSRLELRDLAVVGVSQSGESVDVNEVLREAKARGATTIGVTNESASTLAGIADHTLLVHAGKEQSVAATKTYTGQLLAMYLLAGALGGEVAWEDIQQMPQSVDDALALESVVAREAARYRAIRRGISIGRGLNYANALEFGLKLIETSYVLTGQFSAADLMHGPVALIEPSLAAFVFAPPGVTWPSISEVLGRLGRARARTLVITDERNRRVSGGRTRPIRLRWPYRLKAKLADLYTPIPYIVPAQLFAAYLAEAKGLDPDHPRTLHKVTRTL